MDYPWGAVRPGPNNLLPTGYTFTGQLDSGLGLMYYGARFYDGALGRFIQPDTIVPEPGNPQALNRYSYGLNNPVKFVDSDGHTPLLATALIGGVVGAAIAYVPQVMNNLNAGMSFGDAALKVDGGKVAAGFVGGAVAGGTLGSVRVQDDTTVANQVYYLCADHLGSSNISYRSDSSQTVTQR